MPTYTCPICSEDKLIEIGPSAFRCEHCSASIIDGELICAACGKQNPLGADKCESCQEPLSIFSRVISRHSSSSRSWRLNQARHQANKLKAAESLASDARMEILLKIDQVRKAAERQARLAQQEADRRLFRYVGIAVGVFLLILAITSLIFLL